MSQIDLQYSQSSHIFIFVYFIFIFIYFLYCSKLFHSQYMCASFQIEHYGIKISEKKTTFFYRALQSTDPYDV